jgi:hypothetical protein
MTQLLWRGTRISNLFEAVPSLGTYENDMSRSVAWALAHCPKFLDEFLRATGGLGVDLDTVTVRMQAAEKGRGIVDIEIESPGRVHVIVEAKRGWTLPSETQLRQYAKRLCDSRARVKRLVALTDCSRDFSNAYLPENVEGIPTVAIGWKDVVGMAGNARRGEPLKQRYLLDELVSYLKGHMTIQTVDSAWVYVVAIADSTEPGWGVSWIDIVEKKRRYFHPVGGHGWPTTPPNYIAFRYHGRLQSIHHIDGYTVVTDLHDGIKEISGQPNDFPSFLYKLGPAIVPDHVVKTGKIFRNGRVWCMLDTLLTCGTISEARDLSRRREAEARE